MTPTIEATFAAEAKTFQKNVKKKEEGL